MSWLQCEDLNLLREYFMQTFTGRCLCGQSHITVNVQRLDVYACHCTLCQKWSGGIAMYLEACGQPLIAEHMPEPGIFSSSLHGERCFCSVCGSPLWFHLINSDYYFIPWTILELNESERRRLVLAAEIYIETQPAFWKLTGQYARLSGTEVEVMDSLGQLAH